MVIHIFGASGSGTTTLAKAMKEEWHFYHLDTDDYYWLDEGIPYTKTRLPKERIRLMKEALSNHENCVISGSLCGWGDELIPLFDLAIRLQVPSEIRLKRIKHREKERTDIRFQNEEYKKNHEAFLVWANQYDSGPVTMRSKAMHDEWVKKLSCPLLNLDGTFAVNELLTRIHAHRSKPIR